eukprot:1874579-Alexandrium_andersonii.AAC.1
MSASLVGSEMCIRDRVRAQGSATGAGSSPTRRERGTSTCGRSSESATVSYTHLTLPTICSV